MKQGLMLALVLICAGLMGCESSDDGDDGSATTDTTQGDAPSSDAVMSSDTDAGDTEPSDVAAADMPAEMVTFEGPTVRVSGTAFAFALPGEPYGRIAQGRVSVVEYPSVFVTSDDEGLFHFEALPVGEELTFVIEAEGFPVGQTKTFVFDDVGEVEQVTFQIPNMGLYSVLATVVQITPDPERCQMVSTVTELGGTLFMDGAHGEPGATVSAEPTLDAMHGPIYFNADVLPERALTESSDDGGVLFTNVPPGDYILRAHKDGVTFEAVKMKCRAGVLVNASPPYALQVVAP